MLRCAGSLAALGALTAVGSSAGGAAASAPEKAGATVIKMERDGKTLFFDGPATVVAGTDLKIKNKTNPRTVGPHTFSLVARSRHPDQAEEDQGLREEAQGHLRRDRDRLARGRPADR